MKWHVASLVLAVLGILTGLFVGPQVFATPGLSQVRVQSVRVDSASGSGGGRYTTGGGYGSGK